MFPRRPALWGGVVAPLLWTGLLWATLELINPMLDARIDWRWFIASQVAFGLAAGCVIAPHASASRRCRPGRSRRASGIEAPGSRGEKDGE